MMTENAPTDDQTLINENPCYFFSFGLIVTGKGERAHLPKLFRSLLQTGICNFEVIRFTDQRGPITSPKVRLRMVGLGQLIPDKDESEIGLPARRYLQTNRCNFVILVDDLEYERRDQAQYIFERYKTALNTVLDASQKPRSSMHFLANMLEAYYFGDADAVNLVLGLSPPMQDHQGDVELIRNPKAQLKRLHPGFDEVEDGGRILEAIRVEHILSNPDACAFLRTLFAWCVRVLESNPYFNSDELANSYRLHNGQQNEITQGQVRELFPTR